MKFVVPRSSAIFFALALLATSAFATGAFADSTSAISQGMSSSSGLCAIGAESGKSYAAFNDSLPLAPASIQKLLVSATALHTLGALYATGTEVFGGVPMVGTKAATVFIKAGVDPGFTTERIFLLGRMIRSFGIGKIGELALDDLALVDNSERGGTRAFLSAVSAFGVNWNSYTVRACSWPARTRPGVSSLVVDPFEFPVSVNGKLRVGEGANLTASESASGSTGVSVAVAGVVERGECGEEYISAEDARRYTAAVIKGVFRSAGIEVESVTWKKVPSDAELLFRFPARPLEELLRDMNYFSNNNMAEMFSALLGAENGKFSRQLGRSRVEKFVLDSVRYGAQKDTDATRGSATVTTTVNLVDGSGLSPANKTSPAAFCAVLMREYADTNERITFFGSLPQFGVSGTMKRRLIGVSGRAKTGSLSNVSSLAGVVYGRTEPIVFAIIQNQVGDTAKAKSLEDTVVKRLSAL